EGKQTDLGYYSSGLRCLRREAGGDDLRVGKADGRDGDLVPGALFSSKDLSHHFALRGSSMGQHRLAPHTSDCADTAHPGATLVIDANERAVLIEVDRI